MQFGLRFPLLYPLAPLIAQDNYAVQLYGAGTVEPLLVNPPARTRS